MSMTMTMMIMTVTVIVTMTRIMMTSLASVMPKNSGKILRKIYVHCKK
jgi:hypothetical protein